MPRFLAGDELGSIKAVSYDPDTSAELQTKTLHDGTPAGRTRGIQKLAISERGPSRLASAHADGTVRLASLTVDVLEHRQEWRETRARADHPFVGLALTHGIVYSCAANGALRRTRAAHETPTHDLGALPSRLTDWQIGPSQETFAYGGDEVQVSVWDTRRAFESRPDGTTASPGSRKRKRAESLFPGEVWRAKNVTNDALGLRQPVHNTCLTYMSSSGPSSQPQMLAGTRLGDLRRYDTRSGRRPVNDFTGVAKVGGVKSVEKGISEHEVFVSDQGTNLFALDLRTGGITYGYKGISGTVNSLAVSPSILASVSLDRFMRVHSTFPPAAEVGKHQEQKGAVLGKVYMTTVPTAVIWDHDTTIKRCTAAEDEGDIWEQMEHIG